MSTRTKAVFRKGPGNRGDGFPFAIYLDPRQTLNDKGEVTGMSLGGPIAWMGSAANADELVRILNEDEDRKPAVLRFIFDRFNASDHEELVLVEVEDDKGMSVTVGEWSDDPRGYRILTIKR